MRGACFGIWSVKQHPGGIVPSHETRVKGRLSLWSRRIIPSEYVLA